MMSHWTVIPIFIDDRSLIVNVEDIKTSAASLFSFLCGKINGCSDNYFKGFYIRCVSFQ